MYFEDIEDRMIVHQEDSQYLEDTMYNQLRLLENTIPEYRDMH